MKLIYYKNLDGIRAIAALMVISFHFFTGPGVQITSKILFALVKISVFGQTGVTLFFVLSGFLITRILISIKESDDYFKTFYLRRILRIFPLYYFFLFSYYFLIPILNGKEIVPFSEQLYFYTYFQNFSKTFGWQAEGPGHFWSLAVEEHFYLFWPFIVYYLSIKNLYRTIGLIVIGAFLLRIIMLSINYEVYYFTFTRFDSLAIGALLSLLELKNSFRTENASKFLLLLVSIIIPTIGVWFFFTGEENTIIQVLKYDLLSFTYLAVIAYVLSIREENIVNRILSSSFLSYTGKISYGLYVYHPFAFSLSREYMYSSSWILNLISGISLTYLVAALSYHGFEERILRIKKYFGYNKVLQ
jgi:peptidoglycan/LPS O-acetylase OafA/YrhL